MIDHREPDRFETGEPMLLAGLRRWYGFDEAKAAIPAEWRRFGALMPLPGQVGRVAYGAMCATDLATRSFEYMCAVQVADFGDLPDDLGRMRLPGSRYAVFEHPGGVETIRRTWDGVHEWLASNGVWADAGTPDFERYGEGFDPGTGRGEIEIWAPVTAVITGAAT